jgi:biofilm PGA synthesis N-glycosyltransferase PgaC
MTSGSPVVLPHEMGERAERPSSRGVTIVIPVYNEERGVEGVLERLSRLDLGVPVELLAINDGSRDGTGAVLAALGRRFPVLCAS